jgi:hypothetical protein
MSKEIAEAQDAPKNESTGGIENMRTSLYEGFSQVSNFKQDTTKSDSSLLPNVSFTDSAKGDAAASLARGNTANPIDSLPLTPPLTERDINTIPPGQEPPLNDFHKFRDPLGKSPGDLEKDVLRDLDKNTGKNAQEDASKEGVEKNSRLFKQAQDLMRTLDDAKKIDLEMSPEMKKAMEQNGEIFRQAQERMRIQRALDEIKQPAPLPLPEPQLKGPKFDFPKQPSGLETTFNR